MFSTARSLMVIGMQWGDEGKGKIVDYLAQDANVVVRFQGGANAGHTIVLGDTKHKVSLLPSGILYANTLCVLGSGVVIDPWFLLEEIDRFKKAGFDVSPERIKIAENAPLILPSHKRIDTLRDNSSSRTIGTTGRGIAPAYEDKVGRRGLRLGDLAYPQSLPDKVASLLDHHSQLLKTLGEKTPQLPDVNKTLAALHDIAARLLPYRCRVWQLLAEQQARGRKIIYEGAQGIMLDIDHGSYPYVTSSNTVTAQAMSGSGSFVKDGYVLGVLKAYTTRVGEGAFPTEDKGTIGEHLQTEGQERGTVTDRARRCGWFDAVIGKQAATIAGVDGLALMKIDILDSLPELKICTHYRLKGKTIDYFPSMEDEQRALEPVYETLEGWQSSTTAITAWDDLPAQAQRYIQRIEALLAVPVKMISVSPQRDDIIIRQ